MTDDPWVLGYQSVGAETDGRFGRAVAEGSEGTMTTADH